MKASRILLVENDHELRESLAKYIHDYCSTDVVVLSDGYEALQRMRISVKYDHPFRSGMTSNSGKV